MQRTHRVSIYARVESHASEDNWGYPATGTFSGAPIATNVECNLQPQTGSMRQAAAGREVDASWQGFFPKDTALLEGQALLVTAIYDSGEWISPPASHPSSFLVKQVGYQGGRWDTEAMLQTTRVAVPS